MHLHDPLADGQAQPHAPQPILLAVFADVPAEQVRQQIRRYAPALVRNRNRDLELLA